MVGGQAHCINAQVQMHKAISLQGRGRKGEGGDEGEEKVFIIVIVIVISPTLEGKQQTPPPHTQSLHYSTRATPGVQQQQRPTCGVASLRSLQMAGPVPGGSNR